MHFVADNTVGILKRWMSLLGYDVVYDPRSAREILRDPSPHPDDIIVLGRCPSLAAEFASHGPPDSAPRARFFHLDSPDFHEQLAEVTRAFPIDFPRTIFTRCTHCNRPLEGPYRLDELPPEANAKVPPLVRDWRDEYHLCPDCGRVYWEGTHTARIRENLREKVGLPV